MTEDSQNKELSFSDFLPKEEPNSVQDEASLYLESMKILFDENSMVSVEKKSRRTIRVENPYLAFLSVIAPTLFCLILILVFQFFL